MGLAVPEVAVDERDDDARFCVRLQALGLLAGIRDCIRCSRVRGWNPGRGGGSGRGLHGGHDVGHDRPAGSAAK